MALGDNTSSFGKISKKSTAGGGVRKKPTLRPKVSEENSECRKTRVRLTIFLRGTGKGNVIKWKSKAYTNVGVNRRITG